MNIYWTQRRNFFFLKPQYANYITWNHIQGKRKRGIQNKGKRKKNTQGNEHIEFKHSQVVATATPCCSLIKHEPYLHHISGWKNDSHIFFIPYLIVDTRYHYSNLAHTIHTFVIFWWWSARKFFYSL